MKNYREEEIHSLIHRFESKQLPRVEWSHEAHLVVAVWYIVKYSIEQAMEMLRNKITQYNVAVGTPNNDHQGYHETITRFWLVAAAYFLREHSEGTLEDRCNAFINSKISKSNYPLNFYRRRVLFSAKARHEWVEPDVRKLEGILEEVPERSI